MQILTVTRNTEKMHYIKEFFCVFTALAAFIKMSPYFTWNATGLVAVMYNIGFTGIAVFLGILSFKTRVTLRKSICAFAIIIIGWYMCYSGEFSTSSTISTMIMYILIAFFLLKDRNVQARTFELFYWFFSISLIPALIIYLLLSLGVSLPSTIIQPMNELKISNGHYYSQYFCSVFYNEGIVRSFCGMMDEPGVIGTFCGLLIIPRTLFNGFRYFKNKANILDIVIIISGVVSLSKAFVLIMVFVVFYRLLMTKNYKGALGIIVSVLIVIISLNIETDFTPLVEIQRIYEVSQQTHTLQMFRTTKSFDSEFLNFMHGDLKYVLFGHGYMSSQLVDAFFGSAEIRMLIYDIGFVGTFIVILWIIEATKSTMRYKVSLLSWQFMLLFAFILSMCQRQYVTTLDYIVLLIGGCSYINQNDFIKMEHS